MGLAKVSRSIGQAQNQKKGSGRNRILGWFSWWCKTLFYRTAKLCCLAKDCDNAEYSNLVRALCDEGGVSLVMVDEGKQLGEWAGLCKINEEGEATSVVRCSAACVTEFGEDTRALSVLLTYLKAQAPEDK